jgi:hypothetical protein
LDRMAARRFAESTNDKPVCPYWDWLTLELIIYDLVILCGLGV